MYKVESINEEMMQLINTYFNPTKAPKQVPMGENLSDILGIGGLTLLTTSAVGYLFFRSHPQRAAVLGAAGTCFFISHLTQKSGYAWLVAAVAASGIAYKIIEAVQTDHLRVTLKVDIAEVIRAMGEAFLKAKGKASV